MESEKPKPKPKRKRNRCKGRTKDGRRCRAAAMDGGLCFLHANPDKAVELGRIGGRKSHYVPTESAGSLLPLDSVMAVRARLERVADDLHLGTLSPKIAAVMVPVLTLQIRVIEMTDKVDDTKRKVEQLWAEHKERTGDGDTPDPSEPDDPEDPDDPDEPIKP